MKASVEASVEASMEDMEVSMEKSPEASTEAFTKASTKAFTEDSTKASTEVLPRKLPRIQKLPRKHFHGFLGFSSMEATACFHGRPKAQRLPRKLPRKLSSFHETLEATSTEFFVLLPWKRPQRRRDLSGFHNSSLFRQYG